MANQEKILIGIFLSNNYHGQPRALGISINKHVKLISRARGSESFCMFRYVTNINNDEDQKSSYSEARALLNHPKTTSTKI